MLWLQPLPRNSSWPSTNSCCKLHGAEAGHWCLEGTKKKIVKTKLRWRSLSIASLCKRHLPPYLAPPFSVSRSLSHNDLQLLPHIHEPSQWHPQWTYYARRGKLWNLCHSWGATSNLKNCPASTSCHRTGPTLLHLNQMMTKNHVAENLGCWTATFTKYNAHSTESKWHRTGQALVKFPHRSCTAHSLKLATQLPCIIVSCFNTSQTPKRS